MSEANREQAEVCVERGLKALREGNFETSLRLLRKGQQLYPELGPRIASFIEKAESGLKGDASSPQQASNTQSGGLRHRSAAPTAQKVREEPPPRPYTPKMAEEVKRIKSCKTYYEVLQVSTTSTDLEIKKAYKKTSLATHPDKNWAPGADEAFKRVCSAYDTLSDSQKRATYDAYGEQEPGGPSMHSPGMSRQRHYAQYEQGISPDDIFNAFFGGGGFGGAAFGGGFGPGVSVFQDQFGRVHVQRPVRQNVRREVPTQGSEGDSSGRIWQLLQIMTLFIFIVTMLWPSSPDFVLQRSSSYAYERYTSPSLEFGSPGGLQYFVKSDVNYNLARDANLRSRFERQIYQEWFTKLDKECKMNVNQAHLLQKQLKKPLSSRVKTKTQSEFDTLVEVIRSPDGSCEMLEKFFPNKAVSHPYKRPIPDPLPSGVKVTIIDPSSTPKPLPSDADARTADLPSSTESVDQTPKTVEVSA